MDCSALSAVFWNSLVRSAEAALYGVCARRHPASGGVLARQDRYRPVPGSLRPKGVRLDRADLRWCYYECLWYATTGEAALEPVTSH